MNPTINDSPAVQDRAMTALPVGSASLDNRTIIQPDIQLQQEQHGKPSIENQHAGSIAW